MRELRDAWNMFWFLPRTATTLAIIRIATGLMLAYVHLVWSLRLEDFVGPQALISNEWIRNFHQNSYAWSYLWYTESMTVLWTHQMVAILLSIAMAVGFLTRLAIPLIWFMTLMVCHRMAGFLFGLDQIIMMLSMYLMIAPCEKRWSLDRWLFAHRSKQDWDQPSSMITVATRLMQIHLCIIYLFGGIAKLRGEMWWDGSAMWFSAVAYEYQSLDLTWIGRYPFLGSLLTHITIFWETFYGFLVWPRWSRPWMLALAVLVHGGIALFLGMITFGFMMIVANLAFVEPRWIEAWLKRSSP